MAGSSLLALIDDIASVLDDVAAMTKVATQKTAGVLGDDLALNAQQVTGVVADRELPVVWAVAKGSLINKAILVPAALLISAVAGFLISPLLMLGGAFLCFEGFEKVAHKFLHSDDERSEDAEKLHEAVVDANIDMVEFEKEKVKGAIRTDFILSAEIIVISLGTMSAAGLVSQLTTLVIISIVMTFGVYGLVAGIVKLDDLGFYLNKKGGAAKKFGDKLIWGTPYLMKGLSVFGTLAMFLVGGGILVHGFPGLSSLGHSAEHIGGVQGMFASMGLNFVAGIIAGALLVLAIEGGKKVMGKKEEAH